MKYIFIGLIFAILFTGLYMAANATIEKKTPLSSAEPSNMTLVQESERTSIDVSVDRVEKNDGMTRVHLLLNNHTTDLTKIDPLSFTSLEGVSPIDYIIKDEVMGGHHVKSIIVFEGDLSGTLLFGLSSSEYYELTIE